MTDITTRAQRARAWAVLTTFDSNADADTTDEGEVELTLSEMTDEQLATTLADVRQAFSDLYTETPTDEQLEQLRELAQQITDLQAEEGARAELAATRAEEAATLAASVGAVEEDADEEPAAEEAPAELAADVETVEEAPEPTPVATPRSFRVRTGPSATDALASTPRHTGLQAASGLTTVSGQIDRLGLGRALEEVLQRRPAGLAAGRVSGVRHGVATLALRPNSGITLSGVNEQADMEALERAASPRRLGHNGSLVAAGGWCAPVDTDYSVPSIGGSADGAWTGPEVELARGGVQYRMPLDISTVMDAFWSYSPENVADGEWGVGTDNVGNGTEGDKPCIEVPCPEFTPASLGLIGYCVSDSILTRSTFPEVLAEYAAAVLALRPHYQSMKAINAIVAGSTAITMPGAAAGGAGQVGTIAPVLTGLALQARQYREQWFMAETDELEVVAPTWLRDAFRADLQRRLGVGQNDIAVADTLIAQWFASQRLAVQWVRGWQPVAASAAAATTFPATVDIAMYAPGTWVQGVRDIISLSTLYDSSLLAQNMYTALFVEWGWTMMQRFQDSRVITIPVCSDGATHAGVDIACDGTLVVPAPTPGD